MNKVKRYQVVTANNSYDLTKHVNSEIIDGWQPWGSATVTPDQMYVQPMVKYESE